ncbi:ABC transporter ATP-binding protein [Staphylococcus sp. Marseille-Q5304]|uniref:ABC transporter ATP-binding protein n=1 Tax=Staphylococcus sp. Marseille-Q5304 TaxID=2942200 RepID=UPI0020735B15|nr:ABC transporter ATP-binding protein [Staphylococcus sp. Marseille-Q5304]
MEEIMKVNGLHKSFGKFKALQDVSFSINEGEVLGFIGPNGAGKSTTLRILLGSIKKDGGEAKIFGEDVWQQSIKIHKRLSYVPGDIALWGNLTGGEIIDLFMKLHGKGNQQKRDELIKRFELDPRKKAKGYSKGNRQKIGLIAALAVDSDLYIFDEPTSGLDPLMEVVFQKEVEKLKKAGKTILLSSHILSEVERLADRVAIIREGKVIETGTLDELRHLTRTKILIETEEDVTQLSTLQGVSDFSQSNNQATFTVDKKDLNHVFSKATQLNIKNIESKPPTLEELFIHHYEK